MSIHEASPLADFHRFIGEQLQSTAATYISPEDALALWRERQEASLAVQEGLADIEAGRAKPLDDFLSDFQHRHGVAETK